MWMLILGRFVSGIASGTSLAVAGTYINEVSPVRLRGRFGFGIQLAVTSGIVLTALFQLGLHTKSTWRYLMGLPTVLGAIQFFASAAIVQSPYWLMDQSRDEEAMRELDRLFGKGAGDLALSAIRETDDVTN